MEEKKILVAGYGNIGKALEKIVQVLHLNLKFEFIDSTLNCSIEEFLSREDIRFHTDVLINLTGLPSNKILLLCNQAGIHYIDTGVEVNHSVSGENVLEAFEAFKNTKLNVKAIIGAGMNPGIAEVIYCKYKPDYYHSAIELERDSAECPQPDQIFNTWSPTSFYSEFCVDDTFYYDKKPIPLSKKARSLPCEHPFFSNSGRYYLVPHEEIVSIGDSDEKCVLSAFLYSPPRRLSDFLVNCSEQEAKKAVSGIPVYQNLSGDDCVGIMIHNEEQPDSPYHYYYNRADHQKIYRRFGVNGTSWQVVCGILSAIRILHLLPQNKIYTMTEIAQEHCDTILSYLEGLDFRIERKDILLEGDLIPRL